MSNAVEAIIGTIALIIIMVGALWIGYSIGVTAGAIECAVS